MAQVIGYMKSLNFLQTSVFHLTIIYIVLFSLSVCLLLTFIYWSSIRYLEHQTNIAIEAEMVGLKEQYNQRGIGGLVEVIAGRVLEDPNIRSIYLFTNKNNRKLVGNLKSWPNLKPNDSGWISFDINREGNILSAKARLVRLSGGYLLLIGRDIQEFNHMSNAFKRTLFWGGGLTILLGLIAGTLTSKYMLKRVDSINKTCESVMGGNLELRVQTRNTNDEFDQLGDHINRMLDRVNELIDSVRNVGNNIAHELRTPLTTLRNSLEELKSETPGHAKEKLEEALSDADTLLQTFSALLRISKIEAGSYILNKQIFELSTLVNDACELYQVLAEEKNIQFITKISEKCLIDGDQDLLFQMITNLLDNAIKFSKPLDKVNVTLGKEDNCVELLVCDSGPGIPKEEHNKVLERFYRLNAKNEASGSGLGLSLVKAVVNLHKGYLQFEILSGSSFQFSKIGVSPNDIVKIPLGNLHRRLAEKSCVQM